MIHTFVMVRGWRYKDKICTFDLKEQLESQIH